MDYYTLIQREALQTFTYIDMIPGFKFFVLGHYYYKFCYADIFLGSPSLLAHLLRKNEPSPGTKIGKKSCLVHMIDLNLSNLL